MRKTLVLAIVASVMWISSAEVSAVNYYVSPSGSDTNPGTSELPFQTIQKAADVVVAGDTVIVRDGVYTDSNTFDSIVCIRFKAGTPDNWITFKSENLHGAVLDGENGARDYGFYLYYHPDGGSQDAYVRIEGFEIKDMSHSGIHSRSPHDVYIYKNKIHGIGRNFVGDCPYPPNSGEIIPAGISSRSDTYNVTVDSNLLYDIGRKHNSYCCVSDCKYDHIIYASGAGWMIKNNILYNAYSGQLLKISSNTLGWQGSTHFVTNNVFAHDRMAACLSCYNHARGHVWLTGNYAEVVFQNNIFYKPTGGYVFKGRGDLLVEITFRNNVVSTPSNIIHLGDENLMNIYDNEFISTNEFGLTDPENNDFTLTQSATYLIDNGIAIDAPDYDYAGTSRPYGDGYDIGAYEYCGLSKAADVKSRECVKAGKDEK